MNLHASPSQGAESGAWSDREFDVIVIGAGSAGIYQLYRAREMGLKARLLEAGTNAGGAWYWNRYPGARFDSESYSYGYFFSLDLLREWNWSEHFADQAETERYYNYVVDKFDLRRDMQFSSRVVAARYREDSCDWVVTIQDGSTYQARYLLAAVGPLTAPTLPRIEGRETFRGESYHTARWPKHPVGFEGKRVAVIGTAASGVQTIQEVAKTAAHLTVFQRTANYCIPLCNGPIDDRTQQKIKDSYPAIYARCRETFGWYLHTPDPRSVFDVTPEEREAIWERKYLEPGMGFWQGNFADVFTDPEANELASEFVRRKIRKRVKDQKIAEKLCPKDHGFGTRRVPLETSYYEVYNQPNVRLVDLRETPIECMTPTGIRTSDAEFEFDMIIYATGFNAVTGSFDGIDIRGRGGQALRDKWAHGPSTFVGVTTTGFPNLFMPGGPLTALGNIPRALEYNVDWICDLIRHMRARDLAAAEPTQEAEDEWTAHACTIGDTLLARNVDSWFTGVNTNVDGKQVRVNALYRGGAPAYRARCEKSARENYRDFVFHRCAEQENSLPTAMAAK